MRKVDRFNLQFLDTLDENLRNLFVHANSSVVDFQRDPFALLTSPDDTSYPTFEDVLSGTGLVHLQEFLKDKVEFPTLLMWLDIQESVERAERIRVAEREFVCGTTRVFIVNIGPSYTLAAL